MQLKEYKVGTLTTNRSFAGLFKVDFSHEIKETKADFQYEGPPIPPEVWKEVLSFFKWTNDTMHSESQVRMYVNPVLKTWGAWAHKQEAKTGMSARELTEAETPEEAAIRFGHWDSEPSADWLYFCTVHHHCNGGAFQSSVDEANEKGQDGLHITVGNMDKTLHDIHCRFYLRSNGARFDPDMSLFWDVGEFVKSCLPRDLWDRIARHQMCESSSVPFPDEWKTNVIEIKPTYHTHHGQYSLPTNGFFVHGAGSQSDNANRSSGPYKSGEMKNVPFMLRRELCAKETLEDAAMFQQTEDELLVVIDFMGGDDTAKNIWRNCKKYLIDPDDLKMEMERMADMAAIAASKGKLPPQISGFAPPRDETGNAAIDYTGQGLMD